MAAPVTEVGADDEGILGVLEVRDQSLAHAFFAMAIVVANHQRHDLGEVFRRAEFLLAAEIQIRQVHLQRVLANVILAGNIRHISMILDFSYHLEIDSEFTKGRGIFGKRRSRASVKIESMRWSQDEHTLHPAEIETFVRPGSAWSGVVISCMAIV